jgi:hypothetical protein
MILCVPSGNKTSATTGERFPRRASQIRRCNSANVIDARIFFAGQHQKRASVFLTASLRAFDRVFGYEDHSPVVRGKTILVSFNRWREKRGEGIAAFVTVTVLSGFRNPV